MSALNSVEELYQAYRIYHERGIMSKKVYEEQIENSILVSPLIKFTYIENMSPEEIERNFEDIKDAGVSISGFGVSAEDIAYFKESKECKISSFTTKKCKIGYTSDNTYYKVYEKRKKIVLIDTDEPINETTDVPAFSQNEEYITGQMYMRIRKLDKPLEDKWKRTEQQQRREAIISTRAVFWKFVTVVTELAGPFIIQGLFFNDTIFAWLLYALAVLNLFTMTALLGIGVMLPWMAAGALSRLKGFVGFIIRVIGMALTLVLSIVIVHFPSFIAILTLDSTNGSAMVVLVTDAAVSLIAGAITKSISGK